MILRPFVPEATYSNGDYVIDPDTQVVYQVTDASDPEGDGPVTVGPKTPQFDPDHFVRAESVPVK